jgi:AmmeMemoRadiSam system protein B
MDYPKLRNVEIFPVQMEGKQLICFRDPQRIAEDTIFLPRQASFFISLFDGNHSIRDIQVAYMRQFGDLIYGEQIEEIANSLDTHYFLESDRFKEYQERLINEFIEASVRTPVLTGDGYESDPERLRVQVESFYTLEGGPGEGPQARTSPKGLKGFVAPHIDFMRGGPCYGWACKEVAENSNEDIFILLGTVHMPSRKYFVLTRKSFETPFGILPTDQTIVDKLEGKIGRDFFTDEFLHRNEHSLELQALYLHSLFADKRDIRIVPILCGSFHEIIAQNSLPQEIEELNVFIETLRTIIEEDDRRTCLVAGADLAHVGPQFGHSFRVTPGVMDEIKAKDLAMLDYVVSGDEEGFFEYIMREKDQRNICGLPPIYTFLRLLHNVEGRLLNYSQWRDPDGNGAVTFASLAFY